MSKIGENLGGQDRGYVTVGGRELAAAMKRAGIRKASDAVGLVRRRLEARPGGVVNASAMTGVRKLVQKWFERIERCEDTPLMLQRQSLTTLRDLLGAEAVAQLVRPITPVDKPTAPDDTLLWQLETLADKLPADPFEIFSERRRPAREHLTNVLRSLAKPGRYDGLDQVERTVRRYGAGGVQLARVLEPYIRQLPFSRGADGFEVELLCSLARFANDMAELVDSRYLPAAEVPAYHSARNVFLTVFAPLGVVARDESIPGTSRARAAYEMRRHHAINVQISGDSPFNLSRYSQQRLLKDEDRFAAEMRLSLYYTGLLRGLPSLGPVAEAGIDELEASTYSMLYRGLFYAKSAKLRPTIGAVERILERLESPFSLAKRNSTRLHYYLSTGKRSNARKLCDSLRAELAGAPAGALPSLLAPIHTVNSYRLKGDASEGEYRQAVEQLRADRRIALIYGHHLLSVD